MSIEKEWLIKFKHFLQSPPEGLLDNLLQKLISKN